MHQRHSYGASKYRRIIVQHAIRTHSIDARIVRPFNSYGPRLPGDSHGQVYLCFLKMSIQEPMEIHGNGNKLDALLGLKMLLRN